MAKGRKILAQTHPYSSDFFHKVGRLGKYRYLGNTSFHQWKALKHHCYRVHHQNLSSWKRKQNKCKFIPVLILCVCEYTHSDQKLTFLGTWTLISQVVQIKVLANEITILTKFEWKNCNFGKYAASNFFKLRDCLDFDN